MEISVETRNGVATIFLSGHFTGAANLRFHDVYKPLLDDRAISKITLDLSHVPFADSAALGLLVLFREQAMVAHKKISLTRVKSDLRRILEITHFHKLFTIE